MGEKGNVDLLVFFFSFYYDPASNKVAIVVFQVVCNQLPAPSLYSTDMYIGQEALVSWAIDNPSSEPYSILTPKDIALLVEKVS